MSEENCLSCEWDKLNPQGQRMIQCEQGHARTFQKIIENCHAWKEKGVCWCMGNKKELFIIPYSLESLTKIETNFCPVCGRRL